MDHGIEVGTDHRARRRRTVWIATAIIIVGMIGAGVAVAAFISAKSAAPDTFQASAIGSVDIGNAETTPIFSTVNLATLTPGDTLQRCFGVSVDGAGATGPGTFRVYGAVGGTGLADHLNYTLEVKTGGVASTGGTSCGGTGYTTRYDGTLAGFEVAHGSFIDGAALGAPPADAVTYYVLRQTITLPDTPAVNAGAQGLTGTLALTFHNE